MSNEPTCPKCGAHEFEQFVTETTRIQYEWDKYANQVHITQRGTVDNPDSVPTVQCARCHYAVPHNYLEAWTIAEEHSDWKELGTE